MVPDSSSLDSHDGLARSTVLVVDDEAALRKLIVLRLRASGWHVLDAPDASTAIEIAERLSCHLNLLITDIDMPGIPGDVLIRRIRSLCPHIDVLAISGALPERPIHLANIPYLQKPFAMAALVDTARGIVSNQL